MKVGRAGAHRHQRRLALVSPYDKCCYLFCILWPYHEPGFARRRKTLIARIALQGLGVVRYIVGTDNCNQIFFLSLPFLTSLVTVSHASFDCAVRSRPAFTVTLTPSNPQ